MSKTKKYISFSELMDWELCPRYHHLKHVERRLPREQDEYSAFGSVVHSCVEKMLLDEFSFRGSWEYDHDKHYGDFLSKLKSRVRGMYEKGQDLDFDLLEKMKEGAGVLFPKVVPYFRDKFGDYAVRKTELHLYEPIDGSKKKFKGYVDIILVESDGSSVIIDLKTSATGWPPRYANDKRKIYQLVYYNKFLRDKFGDDSKCHFVFFKWKSKKMDTVTVKIGKRREANAMSLLHDSLVAIDRGMDFKNETACFKHYGGSCPFLGTEHCDSRARNSEWKKKKK